MVVIAADQRGSMTRWTRPAARVMAPESWLSLRLFIRERIATSLQPVAAIKLRMWTKLYVAAVNVNNQPTRSTAR